MAKAFLYPICLLATLASCVNSYNVQGSSSLTNLDGRMLYMKGMQDNELHAMDSCDVIHGEFSFQGALDTVSMVNLFMGDDWLMPFVLEEGPITISISSARQFVSGTPLNDKLYDFLDKKIRIQNQIQELSHEETQAIMNGVKDMDAVHEHLIQQAQRLAMELDKLETKFITDNFDNILGPSIFETICSNFDYPMLTPQIEEIMSRATDKFKNNPFVKDFYRIAQENMMTLQGYDMQEDGSTPNPAAAAAPAYSDPSQSLTDSIGAPMQEP